HRSGCPLRPIPKPHPSPSGGWGLWRSWVLSYEVAGQVVVTQCPVCAQHSVSQRLIETAPQAGGDRGPVVERADHVVAPVVEERGLGHSAGNPGDRCAVLGGNAAALAVEVLAERGHPRGLIRD